MEQPQGAWHEMFGVGAWLMHTVGLRLPVDMRRAAFGLRQSLDTVGAFLGPLLAVTLMLWWANDLRAVFWVALIRESGLLRCLRSVCVNRLSHFKRRGAPIPSARKTFAASGLHTGGWLVSARSSLSPASASVPCLRAQAGGVPIALVPLVMVAMNVVYSLSAYPFGKLSDSISHRKLLTRGLVVLIGADLVLASGDHWAVVLVGVALWGRHIGITQGLLARMVADTAPADLRGTAFGFFNLISGIAVLLASIVAGLLWDRVGPAATFYAGAGFALGPRQRCATFRLPQWKLKRY